MWKIIVIMMALVMISAGSVFGQINQEYKNTPTPNKKLDLPLNIDIESRVRAILAADTHWQCLSDALIDKRIELVFDSVRSEGPLFKRNNVRFFKVALNYGSCQSCREYVSPLYNEYVVALVDGKIFKLKGFQCNDFEFFVAEMCQFVGYKQYLNKRLFLKEHQVDALDLECLFDFVENRRKTFLGRLQVEYPCIMPCEHEMSSHMGSGKKKSYRSFFKSNLGMNGFSERHQ